jgi:mannose-6-phosphate isomerase class I
MGTHPNGPSLLKGTDKSLLSVLDPQLLGTEVAKKYSNDLPFLLKMYLILFII